MAVKDFIDAALTKRQIVALVSLDVKGAFDAAWGPCVVKALKNFIVLESYRILPKLLYLKNSVHINKHY
jgi:hypothetical protein